MTENTAGPVQLPAQYDAPRIRFGPADTQEIPWEWAEKGLSWLFEHRQQSFADMMLFVMGTGFQTGNARKNAANGHRQ